MFQHEQTFVPKIKTCLHHPHVLIDINSPFCRTYISSSACFQCLIVDHSLMICWVFYNHAVCGGILFGFGQLLYLFTTLFDSLNLQVFNSGIALQRQLSEASFVCLAKTSIQPREHEQSRQLRRLGQNRNSSVMIGVFIEPFAFLID